MAYRFEEGRLVRLFWPVLDRAPDTEPIAQILLADVLEATFVAHDTDGGEHSYWPLSAPAEEGASHHPLAAIELRLRLATFGRLERLWLVPTAADFSDRGENREAADDVEPTS